MTKILIDEAVVRDTLEALEANSLLVNGDDKEGGLAWCMDGYYSGCFDIEPVNKQTNEAIIALHQALASDALDKMSDNAKELGLSYEQPAQQEPLTQDMVESCPYDAETLRGAYFDGWLKAEAAHGITKGN
jgi:hypothetical protein